MRMTFLTSSLTKATFPVFALAHNTPMRLTSGDSLYNQIRPVIKEAATLRLFDNSQRMLPPVIQFPDHIGNKPII